MQINRINGAGTNSYFTYKLDHTIYTFSALRARYGIPEAQIQQMNPSLNPAALQINQEVRVPAINPPSFTFPTGAFTDGIITNSVPVAIPFRWNSSSNSNLIGRLARGTKIKVASSGIVVNRADVVSPCQGILDEMQLRSLSTSTEVYGFVNSANLVTGVSEAEITLLARMIYSEQNGIGQNAMEAAALIARNRFERGWGTYNQILVPQQFNGLAAPFNPDNLPDARSRNRWQEALTIARNIASANLRTAPTTSSLYFGNGDRIRHRMEHCQQQNPNFNYLVIQAVPPIETMYYSNGDYGNCSIPTD